MGTDLDGTPFEEDGKAVSSPHDHRLGKSESQSVPISALRPGESPRLGGPSAKHAQELAELAVTLPSIVVHKDTMRVVDGTHRLLAARLRGEQEIEVRFFEGTENDAFVFAVQANVANGLPLSLADRKFAAARILACYPMRSDRWIASVTGLTAKTVRSIRMGSTEENQQSNTRIGRDGRARPTDGERRRNIAEQLVRDNPEVSVRTIARKAGIAPSTALGVRNRVLFGGRTIPAQKSRQTPEPVAEKPQHPPLPVQRVAGDDGAYDATRDTGPPTAESILRWLRADPSLRFKESGRTLIRWLGTRTIDPGELLPLLEDIPAHCAEAVSALARYNAMAWRRLSEQLDRH
ncbi:MAG: ParB/RepB/Spo0J family partition protein [Kibdelosporangium sp.]